MDKISKRIYISNLVQEAREGNSQSLKELIGLFNPLIYKTAIRLHAYFQYRIPINEIIDNGRLIMTCLTLMEYKPGGKAHYPHFLKTHLHARLIQLFRPLYLHRHRTVPIRDAQPQPKDPYEFIYKHERDYILNKICMYVKNRFDNREQDIVFKHIIEGVPRNELARKYGVSNIRMQYIHRRCIKKLGRFLKKMKVKKGDI